MDKTNKEIKIGDPYYNEEVYFDKDNEKPWVIKCCNGWSWDYCEGRGSTVIEAIGNIKPVKSMFGKGKEE